MADPGLGRPAPGSNPVIILGEAQKLLVTGTTKDSVHTVPDGALAFSLAVLSARGFLLLLHT